jgi:hypothetical protein
MALNHKDILFFFLLTVFNFTSSQTFNQDWRLPARGGYACLVTSASATVEMGVDVNGIGLLPSTDVNVSPSILGDLYLEGNTYRATNTGESGTYRYDPNTEQLIFETGRLSAYKTDYFYSLQEGEVVYHINIYIPYPNSPDVQTQFCEQRQPAPPGAEIIVSPYEGQIVTSNLLYQQPGTIYSFDLHNGRMISLGDGFQPQVAASGDLIYVTGMPAQEQFVIRSPDGATSVVQISLLSQWGLRATSF